MSTRMRFLVPAAAAASLLLGAGAALAARVSGVIVTGQVTVVPGGQSITINGQTYQVLPGSAAASAISQVQSGENVDVRLDGPAASSASHVIAISPHQGS